MSSFAGRAGKAVRWSAVSQIGRRVGQIGTTAVLARLLLPADFGIVGMASMMFEFAFIFRDLGGSAAIIQREEITDGMLSTVFWMNVVLGLAVTLLLLVTAPLMALFFHEPRLIVLIRVLGLAYLLTGSSVLQQALLERQLAFERLAKIEVFSFLLGAATAVIGGLIGWGVWSLVAQVLVMQAAQTFMLWFAVPWRPAMVFRWSDLRLIQSYSLNLGGSLILMFIARNADNILIGRYLGAEALGYYSIAYKLMLSPIQSVTHVAMRALSPVFARFQDDNVRFQSAFARTTGAIAMLSFPIMIGVMALSKPLVLTVLGNQWMPVVGLLQILAPIGFLQSVGVCVMLIFRAKGRTDWMFRWGLFSSAVTVISFVVGLRWGVQGVALGYLAANILLAYPGFAIPFRLIDMRWKDFLKPLAAPSGASLLMGAMLWALVQASIFNQVSAAIVLSVTALAGAILYVGVFGLFNRNQARSVLDLLARRSAV
jgi:PST family polysaccharide transporter